MPPEMACNNFNKFTAVLLAFLNLLLLNSCNANNKTLEGYSEPICSLELLNSTLISEQETSLYIVNLTESSLQNGGCGLDQTSDSDLSGIVKCSGPFIRIESGFASLKGGDSYDRLRINCSSIHPLKYRQDLNLPFARIDVIFTKRILPDNQVLHEVSARFPKTLGILNEGLPAYSGTYTFWSESPSWSFPIGLSITAASTSNSRSRATPLRAIKVLNRESRMELEVVDNEVTCQVEYSASYLHLANIGGANNPTEASLLKYCLNITLINACGNKFAGTDCNLDRYCKKISPIHQNGLIRCSNAEDSQDVEYFRTLDAEIETDMSKIWASHLVIKIEEENDAPKWEVKHDNNVTGWTMNELPEEPQDTITLYDQQTARFECHFIHYVLVTPVVWHVEWSNGTKTRLLVDYGENITDEERFTTNDLPRNQIEEISVDIKSSHLQFQALLGMESVICEIWYWDSATKATSVQKIFVAEGSLPLFEPSVVEHTESSDTLTLECLEENSVPNATYTWTFNDDQLTHGRASSLRDPKSGRIASILVVPKLGKSDSGKYTCTAANVKGKATKNFHVTVDVDANESVRRLWLALGVTSILLIFFLIITLAGMYKVYMRRRARLTNVEIREFLFGNETHLDRNHYAHEKAKYMAYDQKYEIPWSKFQLDQQELGKGVHGVVYKGNMGEEAIAVKTVREGVAKEVLMALLDELKIMIYLGRHDYIVELKGACTQFLREGRAYVLVEFCSLGSIESFLRSNRENFYSDLHSHNNDYVNGDSGSTRTISKKFTRKDLIQWSIQIVKGMQYLEEKKVIHGDLAIRNVLMQSMYHVKITDFGLSRKLINTESYVKKHQGFLPWRHMAIESLREFTFTSKSDVWSYGVTLWEIFTLGTTPYPGMNWEPGFLQLLEDDLRLYKPKYATNALYKILTDCWAPEPDSRPSFQQLEAQFSKFLAHL